MTNTVLEQTLPDEGLVPEWTLADRLNKSLKVRAIGVAAMAEALDVNPATISRWINGHTAPRTRDLWFWAILTGVDYAWLTTGDPSAVVDGSPVKALPRLDSNQQPSGWTSPQVRTTWPRHRLASVKPGLTPNRRTVDRAAAHLRAVV